MDIILSAAGRHPLLPIDCPGDKFVPYRFIAANLSIVLRANRDDRKVKFMGGVNEREEEDR